MSVVSVAALEERKRNNPARTRFSTEDKRIEAKVLDELIARGGERVVGLDKSWRSALSKLRSEMPHFAGVIERIEACAAVSALGRQPLRIPPLLLVGSPGLGKTYFASRLAKVLGVEHFVYAMESAETVSTLCGSDKHWANAEAGALYRMILLGQHANPVVVLDELDKANPGSHYRPANALHSVLEPTTSRQLRDKCMDLTFDASYVVYIATTNSLRKIEPSLLSRFELFHVAPPNAASAVSLARAIGRQVLLELGLAPRFSAPRGEVVQQLALLGSPRLMHKTFQAALGRAVLAGRSKVLVADLLESFGSPSGDGQSDSADRNGLLQ